MRHFVYAMNGKAPAPAAGGDTKSWFFFYKWDVGGSAFVPLTETQAKEVPVPGDLLWFIMDEHPLGYAPVSEVIELDGGGHEVHYDTQKIIGPGDTLQTHHCALGIGFAQKDQVQFFQSLKVQYDRAFPARPSSAPPPVPQKENKNS